MIKKNELYLLIFTVLIFISITLVVFRFWNTKNLLCQQAYVTKVYDWDTVYANWLWKIRLVWIDAPEIYHSWRTKLKSYKFYWCWKESKEFATKYLYHKNILFCKDPLTNNRWWYWRFLRYAMIYSWDTQISFWYLSIKNWFAKVYKYADFTLKSKYKKAERYAKNSHIWIWSEKCLSEDKKFRNKFNIK